MGKFRDGFFWSVGVWSGHVVAAILGFRGLDDGVWWEWDGGDVGAGELCG